MSMSIDTVKQDLIEMMNGTDEGLHPELNKRVYHNGNWPVLSHPLVVMAPFGEHMVAGANRMFQFKTERIQELELDEKWNSIISFTERPYRIEALHRYADRMNDEQYWSSVGEWWMDSENIWQNRELWKELLTSDRPGRELIMSDEDRKTFEDMDDTLTVYRAACYEEVSEGEIGMSWTLARATAAWFSARWGKTEIVLKMTIKKSDALAFMNGRNEAEVIVPEPEGWEIEYAPSKYKRSHPGGE